MKIEPVELFKPADADDDEVDCKSAVDTANRVGTAEDDELLRYQSYIPNTNDVTFGLTPLAPSTSAKWSDVTKEFLQSPSMAVFTPSLPVAAPRASTSGTVVKNEPSSSEKTAHLPAPPSVASLIICEFCGIKNSHATRNCPQILAPLFCDLCGEKNSHATKSCPQIPSRIRCGNCNEIGHPSIECRMRASAANSTSSKRCKEEPADEIILLDDSGEKNDEKPDLEVMQRKMGSKRTTMAQKVRERTPYHLDRGRKRPAETATSANNICKPEPLENEEVILIESGPEDCDVNIFNKKKGRGEKGPSGTRGVSKTKRAEPQVPVSDHGDSSDIEILSAGEIDGIKVLEKEKDRKKRRKRINDLRCKVSKVGQEIKKKREDELRSKLAKVEQAIKKKREHMVKEKEKTGGKETEQRLKTIGRALEALEEDRRMKEEDARMKLAELLKMWRPSMSSSSSSSSASSSSSSRSSSSSPDTEPTSGTLNPTKAEARRKGESGRGRHDGNGDGRPPRRRARSPTPHKRRRSSPSERGSRRPGTSSRNSRSRSAVRSRQRSRSRTPKSRRRRASRENKQGKRRMSHSPRRRERRDCERTKPSASARFRGPQADVPEVKRKEGDGKEASVEEPVLSEKSRPGDSQPKGREVARPTSTIPRMSEGDEDKGDCGMDGCDRPVTDVCKECAQHALEAAQTVKLGKGETRLIEARISDSQFGCDRLKVFGIDYAEDGEDIFSVKSGSYLAAPESNSVFVVVKSLTGYTIHDGDKIGVCQKMNPVRTEEDIEMHKSKVAPVFHDFSMVLQPSRTEEISVKLVTHDGLFNMFDPILVVPFHKNITVRKVGFVTNPFLPNNIELSITTDSELIEMNAGEPFGTAYHMNGLRSLPILLKNMTEPKGVTRETKSKITGGSVSTTEIQTDQTPTTTIIPSQRSAMKCDRAAGCCRVRVTPQCPESVGPDQTCPECPKLRVTTLKQYFISALEAKSGKLVMAEIQGAENHDTANKLFGVMPVRKQPLQFKLRSSTLRVLKGGNVALAVLTTNGAKIIPEGTVIGYCQMMSKEVTEDYMEMCASSATVVPLSDQEPGLKAGREETKRFSVENESGSRRGQLYRSFDVVLVRACQEEWGEVFSVRNNLAIIRPGLQIDLVLKNETKTDILDIMFLNSVARVTSINEVDDEVLRLAVNSERNNLVSNQKMEKKHHWSHC